jgi:hypothetical protein
MFKVLNILATYDTHSLAAVLSMTCTCCTTSILAATAEHNLVVTVQ